MTSPVTPTAPAAFGTERRPENLAFVFQEIFTVIERLRSNRQPVTDANAFRHQMREAIKLADQEARKRGYDPQEIQLAIFAAVAFLDESILNLRSPVFADWPRQPMQEEYFGHHVAGEVFFQHLKNLLKMNDSQSLADLLEVFQLPLLLGFAGRYSLAGRGELVPIMQAVSEKIHRIRRANGQLSPDAYPPPSQGPAQAASDPWLKWFLIGGVACLLLCVGAYAFYYFGLQSGLRNLQALST